VTSLLLAVLVVLGVVFRITTAEERARLYAAALAVARQVLAAERRRRDALAPFHDALRARTRRAIVVPAIVAVNVLVFIGAAAQAGPLANPDTLVSWGASVAPRTTNGEWWRLVSSLFVHAGLLHVLVNTAGLAQVGLLAERLVGSLALLIAYLAAGLLASVATLSQSPLTVTAGASGAVFGVYGFFAAAAVAAIVRRDPIRIPLRALKGLAPAAAVFVLYSVVAAGVDDGAMLVGFAAGLVSGVAMTVRTVEGRPPVRRVAASLAAALVIAVGASVPLRGVTDVRPEMRRIVELEDRTSAAYWAAVERFKERKISADALARLIDGTIRPELEAARDHLLTLTGVPPEHEPLVAAAHQYCRLREESWRLRADGLRKTSMLNLRQAESAERGSLQALEQVRQASQPSAR
jgi:membrane associated rhomboid family serine protease